MNMLRVKAWKRWLPLWFVAFRNGNEDGRAWAGNTASAARRFKNMGVTYSPDGEYLSAVDLPLPNARLVAPPPPQPTVKAAPVPSPPLSPPLRAPLAPPRYA